MLSVHGEFYEQSDRGELRRSFDRTFLLGPAVQTNPGSLCVVVSDLLVLRPYSGRDAWVVSMEQEGGLLVEMRRRTGLNEPFAQLLLKEVNGDIEAGVRRFEEAKVHSLSVVESNVGDESNTSRSISIEHYLGAHGSTNVG